MGKVLTILVVNSLGCGREDCIKINLTEIWCEGMGLVRTASYGGVGLIPQLILGCRWYALLLTRSVNTQLALCEV
jgi:hypothetical protein